MSIGEAVTILTMVMCLCSTGIIIAISQVRDELKTFHAKAKPGNSRGSA